MTRHLRWGFGRGIHARGHSQARTARLSGYLLATASVEGRAHIAQPRPLHGGAVGADGRTFLRWVALRETIPSVQGGDGQQVEECVRSLGNGTPIRMVSLAYPR